MRLTTPNDLTYFKVEQIINDIEQWFNKQEKINQLIYIVTLEGKFNVNDLKIVAVRYVHVGWHDVKFEHNTDNVVFYFYVS